MAAEICRIVRGAACLVCLVEHSFISFLSHYELR